MNNNILTLSAAAASFLAVNFGATAAPFNPKDVAADPAFVVHLDVDALSKTSVAKQILTQPDVQDKLSALAAMFSFDPRTQLHGVTIYTGEDHPKDGAMIVYADFDPNRLLTMAKAMDNFHGITNGTHTIYTWVDEKKKNAGDDADTFGAISGGKVVFGHSEGFVAKALEVLDGKANSLTEKTMPKSEDGESVIVSAAIRKFDFDSKDENAAVLKMSKSAQLKLSEKGDSMALNVRLEAANEDTATQVLNLAQGLLALAKLQQSDTNITKLANSVKIKQDGAVVGLTVAVPTSQLVTIIQDGEKKAEEKKEHKEESKGSADNK